MPDARVIPSVSRGIRRSGRGAQQAPRGARYFNARMYAISSFTWAALTCFWNEGIFS